MGHSGLNMGRIFCRAWVAKQSVTGGKARRSCPRYGGGAIICCSNLRWCFWGPQATSTWWNDVVNKGQGIRMEPCCHLVCRFLRALSDGQDLRAALFSRFVTASCSHGCFQEFEFCAEWF